jgi:hypothetical protein
MLAAAVMMTALAPPLRAAELPSAISMTPSATSLTRLFLLVGGGSGSADFV